MIWTQTRATLCPICHWWYIGQFKVVCCMTQNWEMPVGPTATATTEDESCWGVGKKSLWTPSAILPISKSEQAYLLLHNYYFSVCGSFKHLKKFCKYNSYYSATVDYYYCLVDSYPTCNAQCTHGFHTVDNDSIEGLSGFLHSSCTTMGPPK